jgi:hypothetical protein
VPAYLWGWGLVTDWVKASSRTTWYVKGASALWAVGVLAGSLSSRASDAAFAASALCLLALALASIGMIVWVAWRHTHSLARAGWFTTGAGLLLALAGSPGLVVVAPWFPWASVGGTDSWLNAGYVVIGIGIVALAASVGAANDSGRNAFWAVGISLGVFAVMAAALLAPGPGVPYSVGAWDVRAVWRLMIGGALILLPMSYAVLTQLRRPDGHRARVWLWIAAAALVFAMGDVGAALLDHPGTLLYPRALWELGTVFIAAAASLAADYDRAECATNAKDPSSSSADALKRVTPTA